MARVILLLMLLLAPALSRAAESEAVRSARATVTLVAEQEEAAPGQPLRLGLRLRLAPGWHSYWRNAGDAGAPPDIALTLPEGATAGAIQWPLPEAIRTGPLMSYGYTTEVLLPLPVALPASLPGALLPIEAEAQWLVCSDQLCIPEEGRFRLELPLAAMPRTDAALAPLFAAADTAQPRPLPWSAQAGFTGRQGRLVLEGAELTAATVREASFFPDASGVLDHAAPQPLRLAPGRLTLGLTAAPDAAPTTLSGLVVITDGAGLRAAYEVSAAVGAAPAEGLPLWQALAFALLGGLVLNLMPCVFPILAMKAMALARLSGAARAEVRAHAGSYTLGVVLGFLAIGALLLALRAGGAVAGWGFQFTSPGFVAAMAWLMLGVGLNLSGVYAIAGPSLPGVMRHGHAGSFATGLLAVLVATPCTAPFMAAAVGAALAMPPAAALAVFGALGLGLAAPYGLLGLAPGLARRLPRPGPWMEHLRQALAFPMYAAAAWLAWVLAQQAGPDGVLLLLGGAVLLGFAAWALGLAQTSQGRGARLGRLLALAAVLAALALLPGLVTAPPATAAGASAHEPWSASRVAALQAEGRPVFVNLTAAWCITCKVNERLVLHTDAVQRLFATHGVATLVGDWTNGGAAIGALLREHGREGVPLYLLYPAGGGAPALLPQVLTEGILTHALGS